MWHPHKSRSILHTGYVGGPVLDLLLETDFGTCQSPQASPTAGVSLNPSLKTEVCWVLLELQPVIALPG